VDRASGGHCFDFSDPSLDQNLVGGARQRIRTDSLFYRLFQDWPDLVLELAGLATPAAGYTLRAEEIKQTGFRLDGVLVPPGGSAGRAAGVRRDPVPARPGLSRPLVLGTVPVFVPPSAAPGLASGVKRHQKLHP
jgi:hypothetical protein